MYIILCTSLSIVTEEIFWKATHLRITRLATDYNTCNLNIVGISVRCKELLGKKNWQNLEKNNYFRIIKIRFNALTDICVIL